MLWLTMGCGDRDPNDSGPTFGVVAGTVRDAETSEPLEGVTLVVEDRQGITDADGRFEIDGVPAGTRELAASRAGYRSQTIEVEAEGGASVTLALELDRLPGPANVTATTSDEEPGTIRVAWSPLEGATGYTVLWETQVHVDARNRVPVAGASSPFIHTERSGGATYCYSVIAHTPEGDTAPSDDACATPESPISIAFSTPMPGRAVEKRFDVLVEVGSVFQISTVTARLGEVTQPLAPGPVPGHWQAEFDAGDTDLSGPQVLEYTATDVMGNVGRTALIVNLDERPVLTFSAPADSAFAGASVRVAATCSDGNGGCETLVIQANGRTVVRATSSVDQTISLAEFDGQLVILTAVGRDDSYTVTESRTVYADASPRLTPVTNVGISSLIDASADRLLTVDGGLSQDGNTLRVVRRGTGESTVLYQAPQQRVQQGALSPGGAIFLVQDRSVSPNQTVLREWRNGTLTDLASSVSAFVLEGGYALWPSGADLMRRDLELGTNRVLASSATSENDVAATGEVAFASGGEIYYYDGSQTVVLTADGGGDFRNVHPVTDGAHVVYSRNPVGDPSAGSIRLSSSGGQITLASGFNQELKPRRDYEAHDGWVAFVRPDAAQMLQIWRRSPEGQETQVSAFGASSAIDAMGPGGEIVFTSSATGIKRRYRARVGSAPEAVSSGLGRAIYIGTALHVIMGPTLLRVD